VGQEGSAPGRRDRSATGHGLHAVRVRGPADSRRGDLVIEAPAGVVDRTFRHESGRAVATLIRVLGDFDAAEEAVQEAFVVALERWPRDGVPANPGAWITRVARNRAIDRLRRARTLDAKLPELERLEALRVAGEDEVDEVAESPVADDRLRLIFTCCHPALAPEARVALTLRTLGGLSTAEIARAFLTSESAMAQRLVRAKRKIRAAHIPYEVPAAHQLPERMPSVLATVYLIFNEGYSASGSDELTRRELCAESIRLARVLREIMPREREIDALLALMLLHDARRPARVDARGELVPLADQDRSLWDREQIDSGLELARRALSVRGVVAPLAPGPYSLQAAIAAEHCRATTADDTDWDRIRLLYDWLVQAQPSPVVELNRAVAIAMAEGPQRGLQAIDAIEGLDAYLHLHSARADLLRRAGRKREAATEYDRALELVANPVERSFLERRRAEVAQ
jgi:RNA polymerase sigma-70 factor, ECF subfamily